ARQSQLQTAAECVAVHCADQNLFSLFKDSKRSVPLFEVIVWNPSRLELLQIDARAECAARSANYEDSRLWIIAYHLRGLIHIQRALVVHSVWQVWAVQSQVSDSALPLEVHRFEFHKNNLSSSRFRRRISCLLSPLIDYSHRFAFGASNLAWSNQLHIAGDAKRALYLESQALLQTNHPLLLSVDVGGCFNKDVKLVHII